jgi:hypothetical protein
MASDNRVISQQKAAYSVVEFCARDGICRVSLYNYWRRGIGPRFMKVGSRRLISVEAERDWHREREAAAGNAAA